MKRLKHSLLLLPFIGIAYITFKPDFSLNKGHKVNGYTIVMPDNLPSYDGLFWANKKGDTLVIQPYMSREYQIEMDIDSTEIWDGNRLVGKMLSANSQLDSLIYKDNE